jgi:dipeptidyl aminopeptidase/acylaminoacyl peptidase
MPWEGGELHIGAVKVTANHKVELSPKTSKVGRHSEISILSGDWVDAETLSFNNDQSGFWNPWVWRRETDIFSPVLEHPIDEDFDKPAWKLDDSSWCVLDVHEQTRLSYAYRNGCTVIYIVNLKTRKYTEIQSPSVDLKHMNYSGSHSDTSAVIVDMDYLRRVDHNQFVFLASFADAPTAIVLGRISHSSNGGYSATFELLKSTMEGNPYSRDLISKPHPKKLTINNEPLYVIFYPPQNPDYAGSSITGELPPCVVGVHGGPTSMTNQGLSWEKQFYTSRGFAW